MLATANSAVAAVDHMKARGAKDIRFVCLLAAPEGIRAPAGGSSRRPCLDGRRRQPPQRPWLHRPRPRRCRRPHVRDEVAMRQARLRASASRPGARGSSRSRAMLAIRRRARHGDGPADRRSAATPRPPSSSRRMPIPTSGRTSWPISKRSRRSTRTLRPRQRRSGRHAGPPAGRPDPVAALDSRSPRAGWRSAPGRASISSSTAVRRIGARSCSMLIGE